MPKIYDKWLSCEQWEQLLQHIEAIGLDVWKSMNIEQRKQEIMEVV